MRQDCGATDDLDTSSDDIITEIGDTYTYSWIVDGCTAGRAT
jgi:hypothetical protein